MIHKRILPRQAPVILARQKLSGYQGLVYNTGPLAYWPLDEPSGAVVYDRSGHGFHGSYSGPTLAHSPAPGGSLAPYFDGLNDRADLQPAALQQAVSRSEFSLMAWAKVLNAGVWTDAAYREVAHIRVNNTNRAYLIKPVTASAFQFIYNGGDTNTRLHQWSQSSTEWMHLVLTISDAADQMRSYVNSVEFSPPASGINPWSGTPTIGVGSEGAFSWWQGWIAHAAIWNRALSPAEVAVLYAGGS